MFLKRVARLLDGMPMNGYSESCKPIRGPAHHSSAHHNETRQETTSEFELHNQVLQNTWGRIEFEIEPLTQRTVPEDRPNKTEPDYRVRVKTQYKLAPQAEEPSIPHCKPLEEIPEDKYKANLPEKPDTKPQVQVQERPLNTAFKQAVLTYKEQIPTQKKFVPAVDPIRKDFHCRESQRMLTLILQRKANADLLRQKSVFVNFSLPVISTLARSPQTPKSALKWLAFHENPSIRKAVAKNKNTDLEILGILARDEEEGIRMAVAENPAVDKEFLLKLLNDDMSTVVGKAKAILEEMTRSQSNENHSDATKVPSELVDGGETNDNKKVTANETDFLKIVASQATTPSQRLSELAKHNDWNIRMAVAGNPSTTIRTLSLLAQDPIPVVRNKVVANSNCPPDIILNTIGH